MQLRRKKIYLALLAVGGAALLIDRLVLTGSATAPSAALAQARSGDTANARGSPGKGSHASSIPEIPFPRDMAAFDPQSFLPDLFAPPGSRLRGDSRSPTADNGYSGRSSGRGELASSATFSIRHRLDGVLEHPRLKIAVIDGRPVRPGEEIDGCTLESVSGNEASLRCHDDSVVLKVSRPAMSKRD